MTGGEVSGLRRHSACVADAKGTQHAAKPHGYAK
jgi:hypothetical protein